MRKGKLPIVAVSWWDAGSGTSVEEAKNHHRLSVGFLVEDNEDGVVIAMEDDLLSGVHFITRPMVEGIKVLRK